MKPLNAFDALVLFLAGLVLGATVLWIWAPHEDEAPECILGQVQDTAVDGRVVLIGEAVVCGDVIKSHTYGPTLEKWDGSIQFHHDHEE